MSSIRSPPRVAAIQGASNPVIQGTMWRFARSWTERGFKVAGLIESFAPDLEPVKRSARLESLRTGALYPLFQNLGPMASACHLDGAGIVEACAAICEEIERGCDLVVLSKFGQLEARRSGLTDAFTTAVARNIPILTAVSPICQSAWEAFASPLGILVPAEDAALDEWWRAVRPPAGVASPDLGKLSAS